jgi:hypothetical protein
MKTINYIFLSVFGLFVSQFSLLNAQQPIINYIEQGDVEFRSGNYLQAIDNYRIAIMDYPENTKIKQKLKNAEKCHSAIDSIELLVQRGLLDAARMKVAMVLGLNSFDKRVQIYNENIIQLLRNKPFGMEYVSGKQLSNGLFVGDFFMMKNEVSVKQYADFLNQANPNQENLLKYIDLINQPQILVLNDKFFAKEGHENMPVVNVSWYGAKAYANFYGYDLPTSWEWERVAFEQSLLNENFLENAWFMHNSGNRMQAANAMACSNCLFANLYGNVWEWTNDCYQAKGVYMVGCYYHTIVGGCFRTNQAKINQFIDHQRSETMLETIGFRCVTRIDEFIVSKRPSF